MSHPALTLSSSLRLLWRGLGAARYAQRKNLIGMQFDRFGRRMGLRLLARGRPGALEYLLTPVSSVRYFEFWFAEACLPAAPGACLDVASPRLFSYYAAAHRQPASIRIINPDAEDSRRTARIAHAANLATIAVEVLDLQAALADGQRYDCIWSISVVEHIHGAYDDRDAMRMMYAALRPGGRLIVTVPVDRAFQDEYRDTPHYRRPAESDRAGRYFFQRLYDRAALHARLIEPLGVAPARIAWYGERRPGRFRDYERRWIAQGMQCTIDDPREMADQYRTYSDWAHMPGMGVCGLCFEKPSHTPEQPALLER